VASACLAWVAVDCGWALLRALRGADPLESTLLTGEALSLTILESQLYALWLLLAVVVPAAVVLGLASLVARRARQPLRRLIGALTAPAWFGFLWAMTRGGWASAQVEPWHLVLAALAIAAGQTLAAGWFQARLEPRLQRRPALRTFSYLSLAVACMAADRLLFPGLYPPAHALLALAAFVVVVRWLLPLARGDRRWLSLPSMAAVLVITPWVRPIDGDPFMNFYVDHETLMTRHAQRAVGRVGRLLAPAPLRRPTSERAFVETFDVLGSGDGAANLVILSVDGLSPWLIQTASPHDGAHSTTPFIERMARGSVVFERHSATYPMTQLSQNALFTGVVHGRGRRSLPRRGPGLLGLAAARGMPTFCAIPFAASISEDIAAADWQPGDGLCDAMVNERNDARVEEAVVAFASAAYAGPRFIYIHLLGTHKPVQVEAGDLADSDGDDYIAALRTADRRLARIWEVIAGWDRPTRLVLTSDHGHAFGWHGVSGHGSSVYEDQLRIPLILHGFDYPAQRVSTPTSTTHLNALLVGDTPAQPLHAALLAGQPPPQLAPVFASFGSHSTIAVGALKLIVDELSGGLELYDVDRDYREQHNLVTQRPEEARRLRATLSRSGPFPAQP